MRLYIEPASDIRQTMHFEKSSCDTVKCGCRYLYHSGFVQNTLGKEGIAD